MSKQIFDTANWMRDNLKDLGNVSLDELCLPGSHNAGMSEKKFSFGFGSRNNTLTQTINIRKQLDLGIRYFDIRPVRFKNKYYCGHGQTVKGLGYQGTLGQSINEVIDNINEFTSGDRRELVMIDICHCEVLFSADDSLFFTTREYTHNDWNELFDLLNRLNNKLTIHDVSSDEMLTKNTLSSLLKNSSKVIVFISGMDILKPNILPDYVFYNDEQMDHNNAVKESLQSKNRYDNRISIYNKYADKNTVKEMLKDQSQKYKESGNTYFLLSWTLTLSGSQLVFKSIIELARKADEHLGLIIRNFEVSDTHLPNIIFVDNVVNNRPALLSMMINYKKHDQSMLQKLPPFFCLSKETHTSNWGKVFQVIVPFTYKGSTYIFGHSNEDKKWFVSMLQPYGNAVNHEILNGNWINFYPFAVPFEYENEPYMFTQTNANNKWYISKLSTNNYDIVTELVSGKWGNLYTTGVSFMIDEEPYLFSQTKVNKRYFISKLEPRSKSVDKELVSGNWSNYYASTVVFYFKNKPYLFGQAAANSNTSGNRCFMSELSLDKKTLNKELFSDNWGNFYETLVTFEYNGEPYLFGQTRSSGNKFFISKLNPDNPSEVNKELISGNWHLYYNKACVFTYNSKLYLFGLTHSDSKRVFISELICTI